MRPRRGIASDGGSGRSIRALLAAAALTALAGPGFAGSGACCFDDGSCRELGPSTCKAWGGEYQGDGVPCEDAECPTGACCFADQSCVVLSRLDCVRLGGAPRGTDVACEDIACRQVLWDNDNDPNGFNGRAISPPVFPTIRVADDITVGDEEIWVVQAVGVFVLEDNNWDAGAALTVYFYDDADGAPGAEIAARTGAFTRTDYRLKCSFDRECYTYWFEIEEVRLPPGRYWLGPRNAEGSGQGTNYWLTSDGGEGTGRTGWFSLDAGETWVPEGDDWHHAFELRGVVSSCPADVDGGGAVDFDDLLAVLAAWGPYLPCPPLRAEDVDADCEVGFEDLLILLAAWGPCPDGR